MAFAGLVLGVSGLANAGILAYDFEFQLDGETYLKGSFTAEDLNFDHFFRDEELISLSFWNDTLALHNYRFNPTVDDNFNFDIMANAFLLGGNSFGDEGQRWNRRGGPGLGFGAGSRCATISINAMDQGCGATPATTLTQIVSVDSVPEPSTLAIFALGLMGFASRRFKQQS
ncbi:PEP-CTERM sorting domain-containing protein [Rheinheimera riviphila]|uniref:PEP-CTERM sorting domain-containing protein n=2 Tax=Rheinheimera riviphila TaxID=1834037 RepID=A0A437QLM1_9GAMM|nr:PEP-CTERM sorting domain-containing protein [Rheinheimera riviphila]